MATLLIGYDVESNDTGLVENFLNETIKVHREFNAPCTMFVTGKVLKKNFKRFKQLLNERLVDLQQHTYSHKFLFKTIVMDDGKNQQIFRAGHLWQIAHDVRRAQNIFRELGVKCSGITAPFCYYRGLADRPEVLKILYKNGIRFIRSYGRNQNDWQPVAMEVQPFFYSLQGFSDMMEFPIQGWQDGYWRNTYGWKDVDGYITYLKENIDYIATKELTWGYLQHDFTSLRENPDMRIMREFLSYAIKKGVKINTYKEEYFKSLKTR
jgi:peptidoglycan/xylan/chitin deacetylase (PgdA/CDA1 family)